MDIQLVLQQLEGKIDNKQTSQESGLHFLCISAFVCLDDVQ